MPRRLEFWTVAVMAVLAAAWQAWALRWTCDDAFISFRYAQHFVEGHGLVFNLDPTEAPVEGYTNFSWTMLLALGVMFGCNDQALENWSIVWGLICHTGTVLLLAAMAWRISGGRALVPIAACGYAAIHHAHSLAPAGLETALFVLLALVLMRFAMAVRCVRDAWLMGFIGVLCAMTRPDGGIFVAMGGLFVLFDAVRRRTLLLFVGYVAPFVLVFLPYLLWRHAYYGAWVPNTAVAKSAGSAHLVLGQAYVVGFFACYWALLSAVVPITWFTLRRPDLLAPLTPFLGRRPWLVLLAFVLPYIGFVIYVGGDFMFARFLLPVLPMLLLAWDLAAARWRSPWLQPAVGLALVLGLLLRVEPPDLDKFQNAVSDNRRISFLEFAGVPLVDIGRGCGAYLQQLFEGLDVRIGIAGAHANLAYRSRVPVAIECAGGLTDAYIANLPGGPMFKPGHNRPWPMYPDYLLERGTHFMFELSYGEHDRWRDITFPCQPVPVPARLVTWDRELMRELMRRDPNIQVRDFEQVLDAYIADLPNQDRTRVGLDYAKFRRFYFDHNDDPERRQVFESFLK